MSLSIVLRTVCGCERILAIPFRDCPSTFSVPYIRQKYCAIAPENGDSCMSPLGVQRRMFEDTGQFGAYGYRIYLEKLES